jgi:hypothetical protein
MLKKVKCFLGFHEYREHIQRFTLGGFRFCQGTSVYSCLKCINCGNREHMEAIGFEQTVPRQFHEHDGLQNFPHHMTRSIK